MRAGTARRDNDIVPVSRDFDEWTRKGGVSRSVGRFRIGLPLDENHPCRKANDPA
jgi:hypothetical protein